MGVKGLRAGWLASLPEPTRRELAAALSPADARALLYDWPFWARPAQLPRKAIGGYGSSSPAVDLARPAPEPS